MVAMIAILLRVSLDISFAKDVRMISMHRDSKCHGTVKKRLRQNPEKNDNLRSFIQSSVARLLGSL